MGLMVEVVVMEVAAVVAANTYLCHEYHPYRSVSISSGQERSVLAQEKYARLRGESNVWRLVHIRDSLLPYASTNTIVMHTGDALEDPVRDPRVPSSKIIGETVKGRRLWIARREE